MIGGIDDVAIFVAVAQAGNFVGAAKALSLPTSTVSRRIAALEARLGTQLLRRTTRAVSLTNDGKAFAERCSPAVSEIEAAYATLLDSTGELRGPLRVTVPAYVCPEMFGNWLLDFAANHPGLTLDLRLTNAEPDLVEESIDLSFQVGPLRDQRHIARRLWSFRYVLCAHRDFLAEKSLPVKLDHPRDVARVPCVLTPPLDIWRFVDSSGEEAAITPRIIGASSDDWKVGSAAVRRGMGIGYLPDALVCDFLGADLVEIDVGDWRPINRELFAVYPSSRQLSPKVRAVIDFALSGRQAHS